MVPMLRGCGQVPRWGAAPRCARLRVMTTSASTHPGAAIRERLDHPVIDSDGHFIEYLPLVRDFVVEEAGEEVAKGVDRLSMAGAARRRDPGR